MKIQQTLCQGAPILCAGSPGDRHCPRIRPHYRCHRRCHCSHLRRFLPVLCDPGGTPASAQSGGRKGRHYRFPHRSTCRRYCLKGVKGAADWDNQMSTARKKLDWEEMFRLCLDPEKRPGATGQRQSLKRRTPAACAVICLRSQEHEPYPGRRDRQHL